MSLYRAKYSIELRQATQTESEHKNLLLSYHMTHLMEAFQNKILSDDSPS